MTEIKQGFFSRPDLGGEDPEKFRLSLQVANLKTINAELLEALETFPGFNVFDANIMAQWVIKVESAIKKATQ